MVTLGLGKERENKTQNMLQIKKELPNAIKVMLKESEAN